MRVSPAFNSMTSPRLYTTITLGEPSGLSDPFGRATRGVFDIPVKKAWMKKSEDKQKTQGKEKDLANIRHIFFEGYINLNQFPKFTKPADKGKAFMGVKSIRLRFRSSPEDVKEMNDLVARSTNIEKIVLAGTSHLIKAPLDRLSATCKKGVVIIEPHLGLYPPIDWTSRSLHTIAYVFLGSRRNNCESGLLTGFACALIGAALRQGPLGTIILVNAPTIQSPGRAELTLQDYIAPRLRARHDADQRSSNQKAQTSTESSPLQYPDFEYMSMREYLRDCDWAGELTDEEVRPWLEEEEA
jgi:hypothetical protein